MSHRRRGSVPPDPLTKFWDKCKKPFRRNPPRKQAINTLVEAAGLFTHVPGIGSGSVDPSASQVSLVSPTSDTFWKVVSLPTPTSETFPPASASTPRVIVPTTPPPNIPSHVFAAGSPAPSVYSRKATISIWEKAINSLPEEDRRSLDGLRNYGTFREALEETKKAKDVCIGKRWKYTLGGKTFVLRDIADNVAAWVENFGRLGDAIAQIDPVHAAIPWAGVRCLLQVVVGDNMRMGATLVGLEMITNLMGRCAIYEEMYLRNGNKIVSNLENALIELYASILLYLVRAKNYYAKNTAVRMISSAIDTGEVQDLLNDIMQKETYVLREKEIEEAERLKSATQNLGKNVSDEFKKLKELLAIFEGPLRRIDNNVKAIYDASKDVERTNILQWLSEVKYAEHHFNAKQGRIGGEWLFKREEYIQWKKLTRSNILWLRGIPGSGKTRLTSAVVDSLLEEQAISGGSEAVAYFYCERDQAGDPEEIMRTIVKQLSLRAGSPLPKPVIDEYENRKARGFASGLLRLEESFKLILPLIEQYSHTTIVIDALDECDVGKRLDFIKVLRRLIGFSASAPVKIFISSRNDEDIVYELEKMPNIAIRPKDNFRDIKRFVDSEVSNCISNGKLLHGKASETLKRAVIHKLVGGAHGMFLWVDLQIKEICDLRVELDIHERLGRLPANLEKAYSEIYDLIKSEKGRASMLAEKALMWLLCSCRPLSPEDLLSMISSPGVSIDENGLLLLFHNLLVVDRSLNVVKFVHLSVREFFEKHFDATAMNAMAAEFCLSLLNKRRWSPEPKDPLTPIQEYAVLYWPNHLRLCLDQQTGTELSKLLRHFLGSLARPSKAYSQWYERAKVTLDKMWYLDVRKNLLAHDFKHLRVPERRPVLAACIFGFGEKVGSLWESETLNPNYKNRRGESLLYLASVRGYHWIVAALLRKGADFNVQGGSHHDKTPLHAAIINGHEKVVELLLEKGGKLNTKYGCYGSALHAAVIKGHEGVVRLLLEKGADINGQCERYGSPLHAAVSKGHERIVELLLEKGADFNAKSGCYDNALHAAVANGRERVVESLLEKGADFDMSFGEYGSALQAAAHKGRARTVELLLEKGLDVNHVGGRYGTALQAAAFGKHVKVAKILLQHEADVNLQGGEHGDALWAALNSGQPKIVQMLLEHDAEFNDVDGKYGNPLSVASINGHEEVVRVLLELGQDVNEQGGYYGNPLSAACARGRRKAAATLLRSGAIPNARGGMYGSPLLAASISGWSTIVGQLLESGAEVNAGDARHGNALYAASVNGHDKVVKRLLRAGARVNIQGGEHGYALSAAASGGYVKVVAMLLAARAKVNAHGGKYGNALMAAKRHRHQNVVRMLRRGGAVLDSEKLQKLLPHLLTDVSESESDESCGEEIDKPHEPHERIGFSKKIGTGFDSEKAQGIGNESESESDESAAEETFDILQARKRRQHKKVVKILRGRGMPINPENPKDMWDEHDYESDDELDAEKSDDDSDVEDGLEGVHEDGVEEKYNTEEAGVQVTVGN